MPVWVVDRGWNGRRRRTLRLHFDRNGQLSNRDALHWARSVAKEWGPVRSQIRVRAGLPGPTWWMACAQQAGYIAVFRRGSFPAVLERWAVDGYPFWPQCPEFAQWTVLRFEKVRDAAVMEWLYPEAGIERMRRQGVRGTLTPASVREHAWGRIVADHSSAVQTALRRLADGER